MKKLGLGVLGVVSLLLVGALALQADTGLVKANIPFDFVLGNKTLPAGEYTVEENLNSSPLYYLRSNDGRQGIFFSAADVAPKANNANSGELVFDKIGDVYFLRAIWLGSWRDGLKLPEPKHERELLAEGATVTPPQVAVAGH
jgi:hypothetical protein